MTTACSGLATPKRVAAPKAVTILDVLPVTDVGKPCKVALRADDTHHVATEALASRGLLDRGVRAETLVDSHGRPSVNKSRAAAGLSHPAPTSSSAALP